MLDSHSNIPIMDEQENIINSDDEDEQAQMPVDDIQTECKNDLHNDEIYLFFSS